MSTGVGSSDLEGMSTGLSGSQQAEAWENVEATAAVESRQQVNRRSISRRCDGVPGKSAQNAITRRRGTFTCCQDQVTLTNRLMFQVTHDGRRGCSE